MSEFRLILNMVDYDRENKVLTDRKSKFYYQNVPPEEINIAFVYQIFCFFEKKALVWINDKWRVAEPPSVLFVPPMTPYAVCSMNGEIIVDRFFISLSALQTIDDCLPGQLHFYNSFLSYTMNGQYLFSLNEKQEKNMKSDLIQWWPMWSKNFLIQDTGYSGWALTRILWCMTSLLNCWGELPPVHKKPVRIQVIEWVMEHLHHPFTLSDMAKDLYLSQEYIRRKFKKETGLTVMKFVLQVKLSLAAQYMLHFSPREAAEKAGFFDFSYFCQAFKKNFGKTPAQFHKYEQEIRQKTID